MSEPDLLVEIKVQGVTEWLATDHPAWATATRFHARTHEGDGVIVLTAASAVGVVGYAVFDRRMSHLHYLETRKDQRRRGVASRMWARIREEAGLVEVTGWPDSEDGKRRFIAWGFREEDGMWHWRRAIGGSAQAPKA